MDHPYEQAAYQAAAAAVDDATAALFGPSGTSQVMDPDGPLGGTSEATADAAAPAAASAGRPPAGPLSREGPGARRRRGDVRRTALLPRERVAARRPDGGQGPAAAPAGDQAARRREHLFLTAIGAGKRVAGADAVDLEASPVFLYPVNQI